MNIFLYTLQIKHLRFIILFVHALSCILFLDFVCPTLTTVSHTFFFLLFLQFKFEPPILTETFLTC